MIPFSICLITYNEAERLPKVLQSLRFTDDIVVVDSGSNDGTLNLLAEHKVRVIQSDFKGFGAQKQLAVDACKYDWVLCLDADEVPDEHFWSALRQNLKEEPPIKAWYIKRKLVFLGKIFHYGAESRDHQLRFFNRKLAKWSLDAVHEKVLYNGKTACLRGAVHHYSYQNLESYFNKFNRYTSLAAQGIRTKGKAKRPYRFIFLFWIYFLQHYLLKGNVLNGYPGWFWALMSAQYAVVKYTKAYYEQF